MAEEQFVPFPQAKQDQMEARQKTHQKYQSPHHPNAKKQIGATMTAAPHAAQPQAMPRPLAAPIHMPQPGQLVEVVPNSEAEAVSLDLPSQFMLYHGITNVYIKPFKGRHFGKLQRAMDEESLQHTVEAVSSVLSSTEGHQGLAFMLVPQDFYFCMYWLRMNSFLKHQFTHQSVCANPEHHKRVQAQELLPDTLKHVEVINKASLVTRVLKNVPDLNDYVLQYPGIRLHVATMQDLVNVLANPEMNSEDLYLAGIASFIMPTEDEDFSMENRMRIAGDLSGDDIAVVKEFEACVSDFGVEESIKWTCKHCHKVHEDKIEIEPHHFFPSAA